MQKKKDLKTTECNGLIYPASEIWYEFIILHWMMFFDIVPIIFILILLYSVMKIDEIQHMFLWNKWTSVYVQGFQNVLK